MTEDDVEHDIVLPRQEPKNVRTLPTSTAHEAEAQVIAHALAVGPEPLDSDDVPVCVLCGAAPFIGGDPVPHTPECPYRRAVLWAAE